MGEDRQVGARALNLKWRQTRNFCMVTRPFPILKHAYAYRTNLLVISVSFLNNMHDIPANMEPGV